MRIRKYFKNSISIFSKTPKIFWILLGIFFIYLVTSRGGYDGYELENYLTAENLFLNQELSLVSGYTNLPGIDDTHVSPPKYIRHHLAQPFLEVILYAIGYYSPIKLPQLTVETSVSNIGSIPTTILMTISLFNILITVFTILLIYLFTKRILKNENQAIFMGLLYAFGTIAWPYSAIGMEPLMVFSLLSLFYSLFAFKNDGRSSQILLAGISSVILINSKSYAYIFFIPILIYILVIFFKNKKLFTLNNILYFSGPFILGLIVFSCFNLIRFNNILGIDSAIIGYYGIQYIGDNLLSYTLSMGKSMFVYSPIILLSLFSLKDFYYKYKVETFVIFLLFIFLIMVVFPAWFVRSDELWGPRYSNILVPYLIIISSFTVKNILEELKGRILIAVLLVVSMWIQLVGLSFWGPTMVDIVFEAGVVSIDEVIYIPKLSPIVVGSKIYLATLKKNLLGESSKYSYNYVPGTSISKAQPTSSNIVNMDKASNFITLPFRVMKTRLGIVTIIYHVLIFFYVYAILLFLFKNKKLREAK